MKIIKWSKGLLKVNLWKTIYLNFTLWGIKDFWRFPILVGNRTSLKGVHPQSISIETPRREWRIGMIRIGISQGETYADKANHTLVSFSKKGKLIFQGKGKTKIYGGCSILIKNEGVIKIGADCLFNERTLICCHHDIEIGDFFNCGWDCQIYDTDFHLIYDAQKFTIKKPVKKIFIGRNVWLANHVTVAKGSHIPSYSIVGAFSLVNKDFSFLETKGNLFVGSPIKFLRADLFRIRNLKFEKEQMNYFIKNKNDEIVCDEHFPVENYMNFMA